MLAFFAINRAHYLVKLLETIFCTIELIIERRLFDMMRRKHPTKTFDKISINN